MNEIYPACRECPVKCELKNKSEKIVLKAKDREITTPRELRDNLSKMTYWATRPITAEQISNMTRGMVHGIPKDRCPVEEVERYRAETASEVKVINPILTKGINLILWVKRG